MARIGSLPGIRDQVVLIARLRWTLFRNSLRTLKGRLEAVSQFFLWLMMSGLIFGGGAAMGIGAYLLVSRGEIPWLAGLLWIVFLYWQFSPLLATAVGAQFDFNNLLRFPLRFGSFFTLSLAYGLFEPGAVGSLFWLLCFSVGVGIARPALFPWVALVVAVFAAMNLLLARMILTWIDRWLAQRRTRELLGLLFILLILGVQFTGPVVEHFKHHHLKTSAGWIPALVSFAHFLPPGFAGQALVAWLEGHAAVALAAFSFLCVYALAFYWLFRMRLLAQYRGELISETPAAKPVKVRSAGRSSAAWRVPGLSSGSSAIFEKEIRYALRSAPMLLNLLVPVILVIFFGITFRQQPKQLALITRHADYVLPVAVAYTFLIQMNWVFNSFAYEGTGIQFLFLSPVRFSEVMAGKNLFHGVVAAADALLVWIAVAWFFERPSPAIVAATLTALLFEMLATTIVGNILSICYPRRMVFGRFRRNQAGVTMAVGLLTDMILIGITAIVFIGTISTHHIALATPIFVVLAAGAAVAYRISLGRLDKLALDHRETLTAELCRP